MILTLGLQVRMMPKLLRILARRRESSASVVLGRDATLILQIMRGIKQLHVLPDMESIWTRFSFPKAIALLRKSARNMIAFHQNDMESDRKYEERREMLYMDLRYMSMKLEQGAEWISCPQNAFPYDKTEFHTMRSAVQNSFLSQAGLSNAPPCLFRSDDARVSSRAFLQWLTEMNSKSSVWLRASRPDIAQWQAVLILWHMSYLVKVAQRSAQMSSPRPMIARKSYYFEEITMCSMQLRNIARDWKASRAEAARLSHAIEGRVTLAILELVIASKRGTSRPSRVKVKASKRQFAAVV